tara:strand:- start:1531 stop:1677 length:147 start_codon:yes stop_codon:yes gene_type:complete
MPSIKGASAAAASGVGLAIMLSIMNGLSTYILPDGQTIQQWVNAKVSA